MKPQRILLNWLQVAGATIAGLAVGWIAVSAIFHMHVLSVQTGSMVPTFRPGDALIIQQEAPSALQYGQVVSYRSARNRNELVTHRVVSVASDSFQTKGNTLTVPDPPVRNSLLVGRVVMIFPGLGTVLDWLKTWPGLIASVYVPALAIAVSELNRMERHYRRLRTYHIYQPQVV